MSSAAAPRTVAACSSWGNASANLSELATVSPLTASCCFLSATFSCSRYAGYAAIYAYREQLKVADKKQQDAVKGDKVASSLKFADAFPQDEHAATGLGAAADDM